MEMQQVLDKYFKDGKVKYFRQSDAHANIEGDAYLRYAKNDGIELYFGGDNGEVCILHTRSPEVLEKVIQVILNP